MRIKGYVHREEYVHVRERYGYNITRGRESLQGLTPLSRLTRRLRGHQSTDDPPRNGPLVSPGTSTAGAPIRERSGS